MVYPPGQGESGQYLMELWRRYLEQYAEQEGDVEGQIVVGSYYAAEIFGSLSKMLDRGGKHRDLIEQRIGYFREGRRRAETFDDRMVNATFSLYNHLNTLSHQFTEGNAQAEDLIRQIDAQVHLQTEAGGQIRRSAAALSASFPLLSLMTLVLTRGQSSASAIRQVEQRFAAGAGRSTSDWETLLNALYRAVEMMQILVLLSDADLRDQVEQMAARFQEEDQSADLRLKLRNGFCRLFELGHLLTTHLDGIL